VLQAGFTIIELLLVIAILGILANIVLPSLLFAKERARYSRALLELRQIEDALHLYNEQYGTYPNDASRNIPPGLEEFLAANDIDNWPDAPWSGSVYDWDAWDDPDTPGERIYQISIRFCPIGGPIENCNFPHFDWALNFGVNSAMYYCVSGACRAHIAEPIGYPGYCVNC
jgi:prepilin-type N-terminal cleavage/methylation domain-containing protein